MFAFVGTRSAGHAAPEEIIIERAADKSIARLPFIPFFSSFFLPSFRYAKGILKHWKTFKDGRKWNFFRASSTRIGSILRSEEKPVPRFLESLLSLDHGSALSERSGSWLRNARRAEAKGARGSEDFRGGRG